MKRKEGRRTCAYTVIDSQHIGQELRIEPPLSADRVAATRLGIRLVNHLVLAGGLAEDDRIIAPDGSRLLLRPSRSRALINVWRE